MNTQNFMVDNTCYGEKSLVLSQYGNKEVTYEVELADSDDGLIIVHFDGHYSRAVELSNYTEVRPFDKLLGQWREVSWRDTSTGLGYPITGIVPRETPARLVRVTKWRLGKKKRAPERKYVTPNFVADAEPADAADVLKQEQKREDQKSYNWELILTEDIKEALHMLLVVVGLTWKDAVSKFEIEPDYRVVKYTLQRSKYADPRFSPDALAHAKQQNKEAAIA